MERALHVPVLAREVLELLALDEGAIVVDVTAGAGGHLRQLLEAVGPTGRVIALDRDPRAHLEGAAGGVVAAHENASMHLAPFSELPRVLAELNIDGVDGLLADIGVSSMQLDETTRGFSFRADARLDMRMGPDAEETAYELMHRLDEGELADVIYNFGEERKSRHIAHAIKRGWPIVDSTTDFAELVARAVGGRRGRIHPATRTFQALRIAVNRELDELDALLDAIPEVLAPGGRACVISFHSLEDRRVKHRFKDEARDGRLQILTKRPLTGAPDEVRDNPRARSAKLRAVARPREDG